MGLHARFLSRFLTRQRGCVRYRLYVHTRDFMRDKVVATKNMENDSRCANLLFILIKIVPTCRLESVGTDFWDDFSKRFLGRFRDRPGYA